jgi:hypothetical protein
MLPSWSLIFLSRRLYAETRLLPYQMSTFNATNDRYWIADLHTSLRAVKFDAITSVSVLAIIIALDLPTGLMPDSMPPSGPHT